MAVHHEEAQALVHDGVLDLGGQPVPHLAGREVAVEQERGPGTGDPQDVHTAKEPELVAGHEVGLVHEIGGVDGIGAEPQVRDGDRPGLLRVEDEVPLRVAGGVPTIPLGDDPDGVAVRPDGAVAAEAVEDGPEHAGVPDPERRVDGEARVGHVVDDADREVVLRPPT